MQIASLIDRLKATYVASSTGLLLLNAPELSQWLAQYGVDVGSTVRLGRRDNSYYEGLDVHQSLALVQGDPAYNLDFLRSLFITVLSILGDALARNGYFDKTPELEFVRHLRNAVSHGNKFHFTSGGLSRSAQFGALVITGSLQDQPALFEFIGPGDLFALFDHVAAHLRQLGNP